MPRSLLTRCSRSEVTTAVLSGPVPGDAMEALLSTCWMPMPFLADREALSLGAR
ncbi:cyclic diguanylate phosphodiesterase domain-containing protein [Mycobacterium haemophilum DSM 44634]